MFYIIKLLLNLWLFMKVQSLRLMVAKFTSLQLSIIPTAQCKLTFQLNRNQKKDF